MVVIQKIIFSLVTSSDKNSNQNLNAAQIIYTPMAA